MQAHIDKVNFQSNFLFKSSIRGANTNEPTPEPAIVIPVATPRFLSKYSAITIIDAIYVQPVDKPFEIFSIIKHLFISPTDSYIISLIKIFPTDKS